MSILTKIHLVDGTTSSGHRFRSSVPATSKLSARLGAAVAAARRDRGWSQEELAERLDVSKNFIGLIERGQSFPSIPHLVDLSMVVGLSLDRVLLDRSAEGDKWSSETAALLQAIAPEFRDLAKEHLRCLALMRPVKEQPRRRRRTARQVGS